jgi:hypothetical protein
MEFAFGFLLASLIALAISTSPERALCNLKVWMDRLKGSKSGRRLLNSRAPGDTKNEEHNSGVEEEDTRGGS